MAKKKLVEHNALVQAIEMGTPQQDLMEKFGFKSLSVLKTAYLNALVTLDKVPPINTKRRTKKVDRVIQINSRGSLIIPRNLIEHLALSEKDSFKVEKNGPSVSLTANEKPPRTILRKRPA